MTREEKQKAIDALKISVPVKAMAQEEFNDYIQTLNKIMDWLEQELCEDCISRQDALNAITMAEVRWQAVKHIKELPPVLS